MDLPGPPDDAQQDPGKRNNALAVLLMGGWNGHAIVRIRREPIPPNPTSGRWVAEI